MSVTRGKFRTAIGAAEGRSQLMAAPDSKIMGSKLSGGNQIVIREDGRARGGPDRIGNNLMFPSMWRHYAHGHGHAYQTGDQIVDEFYRARLKGGSQVE